MKLSKQIDCRKMKKSKEIIWLFGVFLFGYLAILFITPISLFQPKTTIQNTLNMTSDDTS